MEFRNKNETREALTKEINELRNRCEEACFIIENNAPMEMQVITPENVKEKTLCYIEGLRTNIANSNVPIRTDFNLITSQFLNELKEKTSQVEELIAFTKSSINDVDNEIYRLNNQIQIAQQAKLNNISKKQEIQPVHMQKAKEKFYLMKNELLGLISSMFPNEVEEMRSLLAKLMGERMDESSNTYIPVTSENYHLIEQLKNMNIIKMNPYNKKEVRLAY